jgi:NAD(P)H-hydrate epimerase
VRAFPPVDWRSRPLLPAAATARLDAAALAAGIPGATLMENAGRAVARAITARFPPQPLAVLCGPGNNGGDGYVVARRLAAAGWPVRVLALGDPTRLAGDARARWLGPVEPVGSGWAGPERLVVDALFGVGLARPIDGAASSLVEALNAAAADVVAVDIASGIAADTGAALGAAVRARLTVSFCTAKPGHLLLPGRLHTGELLVEDIGIDLEAITAQATGVAVNAPARWAGLLPARHAASHKYTYGHALVVGGPPHATGAARLAAEAALRVGAGLVTVAATPAAVPVYAARLTAVMVRPLTTAAALRALAADRRVSAALIGPAAGTGEPTLRRMRALLATGRPLVLDADALTVLGPELHHGAVALHPACVVTPHDAELARLLDVTGDRLTRARAAAAALGSVVLLKGADTVVAEPGGAATILADAPATLATAGSGDVLAGIVVGLLAQGVPTAAAAAAAAWLHAEAARRHAGTLTAEDLAPELPAALALALTGRAPAPP